MFPFEQFPDSRTLSRTAEREHQQLSAARQARAETRARRRRRWRDPSTWPGPGFGVGLRGGADRVDRE
ncbi:hypothetical protein [Nocardiopsis ganjiahuensis]|uniref:hypothetical protein n=1 Tax=Nocardiopsis ganjiahuensis TaxID=239984 RepID=UPI0003473349|nr:hypothetical protein [Nocardiopsis ganjiahuensis]